MRILICASEAPLPPLNGARLALREIATRLSRTHSVSVIAFRWPDQHGEPPAGVELRELAIGPLTTFVRALEGIRSALAGEPAGVTRLRERMVPAIHSLRQTHRFDVAHVMLGELASVAPALSGIPAVIVPLDHWPENALAARANARGVQAPWLALQHRLIRHYVSHAYRPFARVVFVTDEDAQAALALDPTLRTAIVSHGVDADDDTRLQTVVRHRRRIVFTGALSFPPNAAAARWLASAVLPRVQRQLPDAELLIAGRQPLADVLSLANLRGVTVERDVADLRPYLRAAGAYACAMTVGAGIKNKLLEAMACGAPCVSTSLGARGLLARDGEELLIADDEETMAAALVSLLSDSERAGRLAAAALQYVRAHHSWDAAAASYERIYDQVVREALGTAANRSADQRSAAMRR